MNNFNARRPSLQLLPVLSLGLTLAGCIASEPEPAPSPEGDAAAIGVISQAAVGDPCTKSSQCNDGSACTTDRCVNKRCENTPITCSDNNVCTVDTCNPARGCVYTPGNAGAVCRASASACDAAEMCTGSSAKCPMNRNAPAGTVCRAPAGECDTAETCSGSSSTCPADVKLPSGTACGDDGNACTTDRCDGTDALCQHAAGNAGAICRDVAGVCDVPEACSGTSTSCPDDTFSTSGTVCRASTSQCDATETCSGAAAECPGDGSAPDGTTCNDGNPSTTSDVCTGGVCAGVDLCAGVTCTASDACHVAGTCNPATGQCSNPAAPDGTTCSDGNACTQTDVCQAGACTGTNPVVCSASDQCHVAGVCDPATGTCSDPAAADGTVCSDGDACTQTDVCQAGTCDGTNPVACSAQDQCHVAGTCDHATGQCSNPEAPDGTVCSDGDACTQTDACQAGACSGENPVVCTASDQCHVAGVCDPSTGTCSNPNADDGTLCSDGDACTQTDACDGGSCVGDDPVVCTALDQCHDEGLCDSATGVCSNPQKGFGTPCDDLDACTQSDVCDMGSCVGSNPVVCTALDQCHVAGACDGATGACSNPPQAEGTTCDDADACTAGDACDEAGVCGGSPVDPDDFNLCTDDSCDPATGVANTAVVGRSCEDGDACTVSDACDESAACVSTTTRDCSDGEFCTGAEGCDSATGCTPGTPPVTDDGIGCTDDSCDEAADAVVHAPNDATCSDQDVCDGVETCDAASGCLEGTPPAVDDGIACTADACDAVSGVSHTPNHASCNDGNVCTADVCDVSSGCGYPPVDDGTSCSLPNASAACVAGGCAVSACDANYGDCDGAAPNGCEVDVTTSNDHCGACGNACASNSHCELGGCVSSGVKLATGAEHGCVVMASGRLMCWGANANAQLGDGTTNNRSNPVYVAGISDATQVDAGYGSDLGGTATGQTCALRKNGTIACWGNNQHGQLGDGTQIDRSAPVQVLGISDALAVSTARNHSCALRANGRVMCWGHNFNGTLGNGTFVDADFPTPGEVVSLTDAIGVAAGDETTCALRATGQVVCWGYNRFGEGGFGNYSQQHTPTPIASADTFTKLASGYGKTCAIRSNGTVMCWGDPLTPFNTPTQVSGLTGAVEIAVSHGSNRGHACAVLDIGGVRCWGSNDFGQLGNGTTTFSSSPVVVGGVSTAVRVACGNVFSCAVLSTDHVTCWGRNNVGNLGDGTFTSRTTPAMTLLQYPGCTGPGCATPQTGTITVDGKSNIWGAGIATPPGANPGLPPPIVPLNYGTGAIITFPSVTGTVNERGAGSFGPDGETGGWAATYDFGGIAGYNHTTLARSFVGVFLGPITPAAPAPSPRLSFIDGNFPYLYPVIGQTFFIGDGRTAGGALHEFHVPLGATRVALGVTDLCSGPSIGCFSDNTGSYSATYSLAATTPTTVQVDLSRFPNGSLVPANQVLTNQWQSHGITFSARASGEPVGQQGSVNPISAATAVVDCPRFYFFSPDVDGAVGIFRFVVPGTDIPINATHFEVVAGWDPGESITLVGLDENNVVTASAAYASPGSGNAVVQLDGVFRAVELRTDGNPGIGFANCAVGGLPSGYGLRFTRQ